DEAVLGYQPSHSVKEKAIETGEPIPVVYIKRKPHPNGLLIYHAVTMVRNPINSESPLPFIVDMLPHLTVGDGSAVRAFERFIDRWTRPERPHFISDAAFGSEHLLQKVSEFGGTATFSCSVKVLSFLW